MLCLAVFKVRRVHLWQVMLNDPTCQVMLSTFEMKTLCMCACADHPYFVGVQYHPEYLTRPLKPSPPYLGLMLAACGKLVSYVAHGCRFSPYSKYNQSEDLSEEDEDAAIAEELVSLNLHPSSSSEGNLYNVSLTSSLQ